MCYSNPRELRRYYWGYRRYNWGYSRHNWGYRRYNWGYTDRIYLGRQSTMTFSLRYPKTEDTLTIER
jgi:hypothetical protein